MKESNMFKTYEKSIMIVCTYACRIVLIEIQITEKCTILINDMNIVVVVILNNYQVKTWIRTKIRWIKAFLVVSSVRKTEMSILINDCHSWLYMLLCGSKVAHANITIAVHRCFVEKHITVYSSHIAPREELCNSYYI